MRKVAGVVSMLLLLGCEVYAQGVVREVWVGKTLANPGDLIINPNILGTPTTTEVLTASKFSVPVNQRGPFVARYTTKLDVPITGNYTFFLTATRQAGLWINTPTNLAVTEVGMGFLSSVTSSQPTITQWSKYPGQKSVLVNLTKGAVYYLQGIQVESDTDNINHFAVGWQLATGLFERPIPNSRLTAVVPDYLAPTITITSPVSGQLVAGTVSVWTQVSDSAGVAGVRFQVDGVYVGVEVTATPFYLKLDTRLYSNGQHTVTVFARDSSENVSTKSVLINIANVTTTSPVPIEVPINPQTLEFEPSLDHFTMDEYGNPLILSYGIGFYAIGATRPVVAWNFGKPALQYDGRIRYNFASQPQYYMVPLEGIYEIRVWNVTAIGVFGVSEPSPPLQIVR